MDWQLKPQSRKSEVSGDPFTPGEKIICFIFKTTDGELSRVDIKDSERDQYSTPADLLARWTRIAREKHEEDREAQKQAVNTAEELFVSLFDQSLPESESTQEDKDVLKQIIALMLERKRVIKRIPGAPENFQKYILRATEQQFDVPTADLHPQQIVAVQDQLKHLLA